MRFLALAFCLAWASASSSLDCPKKPYGDNIPYKTFTRKICGLNNPRGVVITNDGAFVAEAGTGGNFDQPSMCRPSPENGLPVCAGNSAGLVQRKNGENRRVLTGLLSVAQAQVCAPTDPGFSPAGLFATGLHHLGLRGDRVFGAVTNFSVDASASTAGKLMEFSGFKLQANGETSRIKDILSKRRNRAPAFRAIADLSAYEKAHNPDGMQIDSNPYGVVALPNGEVWASDAGGNDLFRLVGGQLVLVASFANRGSPSPLDTCKPSYEPVPTALAYNPRDGNVYVGELTGFPFPQGEARVYKVARTRGAASDGSADTFAVTEYASGFTMVLGLAFDEFGNLFVLEFSHIGLGPGGACPGPPPATTCQTPGAPAFPDWCHQPPPYFGALYLVKPTGEKSLLVGPPDCSNGVNSITHEPLIFPGGLAYKKGGKLYISNRGVMPGIGELVSFDVSQYQPKYNTHAVDVDAGDN